MTLPPKYIEKTVPIDNIRATSDLKTIYDVEGIKNLITKTRGAKWHLHVIDTENGYYFASKQNHILEAMKQLGWKEVLCYIYIGKNNDIIA